MGRYYTVQQGDCLASICKGFGFTDYKTVYDHPNNADFRDARPNPNVICKGDCLYIPDLEHQEFDRPVDQVHKFMRNKPKVYLRVVVQDEDGRPFEGAPYRLILTSGKVEGATKSGGLIDEPIPEGLDQATLEVNIKAGDQQILRRWVLKLGHLDPVEKPRGIQARLNNLGFDCGKVDGIIGEKTEGAIREFQEWAGLDVDGIAGPQTQDKLQQVHGS